MRIFWKTFKEKYKRPPKNQFPVGSIVFKGFQGSGKTLSLVQYVIELQKEFPDCKIYSNVIIKGLKNFKIIENDDILAEALTVKNGSQGVAVVLDEAHLYFGKKSGIPLDVLTAISQQRKDRRRMIFTSQIWEELDISLRKQVKDIVNCRNILGMIQINTVHDGETLTYDKLKSSYVADKKYTYIFKHNETLYNLYDTYQKIISNQDYHRDISPQNIAQINVTNKPH